MKTVLLVDGDGAALAELGGGLAALAPEVRVMTARHGAEAVERLRAGPVDVLATALVMPVMDGFELLDYALERDPGLDVVVMEERSWGRLGQALTAGGAFRFLDKPVSGVRLAEVVRELCAAGTARASLDGLSLAGVLQLLGAEGRSCRVRVHSGGREARVDLVDGEVVDAESPGRIGLEALVEALAWERPSLTVGDPAPAPRRRIHDPLPVLLLHAAHFEDLDGSRGRDEDEVFRRLFDEGGEPDGEP
jgi:CheY-like chemotaxis protein